MRVFRQTVSLVVTLLSLFWAKPVLAIDAPLTDVEVVNAITYGTGNGQTLAGILSTSGYQHGNESDFLNMWQPGDLPIMFVETPWFQLAEMAQKAKATYSELDQSKVTALKTSTTFQITGFLYASSTGVNTEAVVVIKQGSAVIHPLGDCHIEADMAIKSRSRGMGASQRDLRLFQTGIAATFEMSRIDLTQPFSVILANTKDGEWTYKIDPTKLK